MSIFRRCLPFSDDFHSFSHSRRIFFQLDLFYREARCRNGCDSFGLTAALAIGSAALFPGLLLCPGTLCRRSRTLRAFRFLAALSMLCTMYCLDLCDGLEISCSADLLSPTMVILRSKHVLASRYCVCNHLGCVADSDEFGCMD